MRRIFYFVILILLSVKSYGQLFKIKFCSSTCFYKSIKYNDNLKIDIKKNSFILFKDSTEIKLQECLNERMRDTLVLYGDPSTNKCIAITREDTVNVSLSKKVSNVFKRRLNKSNSKEEVVDITSIKYSKKLSNFIPTSVGNHYSHASHISHASHYSRY